MIKAAIFDLDGVIVLAEPFELASINEALAPYGLKFNIEDFIKRFSGMGTKRIMEQIVQEHQLSADVDDLVAKKRQSMDQKVENEKIPITNGAISFITSLQEQKIPVMIGTGGFRNTAEKKMKNIGLEIDMITTADVENGKPAPDIYLKCAEKMGIKPKYCVVFEDAPNGVRSAKAAGMRCVALTTGTDEKTLKEAGADLVVKDFTQVNWKALELMF